MLKNSVWHIFWEIGANVKNFLRLTPLFFFTTLRNLEKRLHKNHNNPSKIVLHQYVPYGLLTLDYRIVVGLRLLIIQILFENVDEKKSKNYRNA